jgi:hypothetical protein
MATFNKFQDFVEQLGKGVHNFSSHAIKVYLTDATPSASADAVKADLPEITAQNGYPAGGSSITPVWTETGGTATLSGTDVVFTASGGSFGPFRYVVLYNDTSANDNLIAWWDYGSEVTCHDGETFTVDFGASILTIT